MRRALTTLCLISCIATCANHTAVADDADTTPLNSLIGTDSLSFCAFIDTYASIDFNDFDPRTRSYLTQPARDREPNVNLGFGEVKLSTDNYRGRIAIQGGSSVDSNYAAEPSSGVKYVQEAVVGTKLTEDLWIDGGIYLSHIGMESWISRDNWGYTRLLASEFSPYYQSGVKLTYDSDSPWNFQLHLLNGWQNISNFDGRSALGTQVSYISESKWEFIYNTFLGNELEGTRFFSDVIIKPPAIGSFEWSAVADLGTQDRGGDQDQWWTVALLSRYSVADSLKLIARVEKYDDPENVVVTTVNGTPFRVFGLSLGIDVELTKRLWWRSEYRAFFATEESLPADNSDVKDTDHFVVTSLSYTI